MRKGVIKSYTALIIFITVGGVTLISVSLQDYFYSSEYAETKLSEYRYTGRTQLEPVLDKLPVSKPQKETDAFKGEQKKLQNDRVWYFYDDIHKYIDSRTSSCLKTLEKPRSIVNGLNSTTHQTPVAWKAKKKGIPNSSYDTIPKPIINLSFPKTGTTSLNMYLECGGVRTSHNNCFGEALRFKGKCAYCIQVNIDRGAPPLDRCGGFDAYTEIESAAFGIFPQIDHLREFHDAYPEATFVYTWRPFENWIASVSKWYGSDPTNTLRDKFSCFNITGLPAGAGEEDEDMRRFYDSHRERIRAFVRDHPGHRLIEIDVESEGAGDDLENTFGIDRRCWGNYNHMPGEDD